MASERKGKALHGFVMREAVAASRMKPKPMTSERKLTKAQRARLATASGCAGIITTYTTNGRGKAAFHRGMRTLCGMGLATANAHGDYYITPAGRAALERMGD